MSDFNPNRIIWERSKHLSRAYWTQYQKLIGPIGQIVSEELSQTDYSDPIQEYDYDDSTAETEDELEYENEPDIAIDINLELEKLGLDDEEEQDEEEDDDGINPEYLEFIKITRQHQLERDRLRQLEQKKRPDLFIEEYYKDISQVNTLIEDNLVEAPDKDNQAQMSSVEKRQDELIELYGGREVYESIRSLEMIIDEHFNKKLQELSPKYWPVMPLNPKPYLNPLK